ncbi:MAG: ribonuclease H family protein, partial [Bacteroidota bacterium]
SKKSKYYVVWVGQHPGVYDNWGEAKLQITAFPGAKYKSFESKTEATKAFREGPAKYLHVKKKAAKGTSSSAGRQIKNSLSVDAACSGNPGLMEYRGVNTNTGAEIFHMGPFKHGTNNVGEFLALVHGLALLKKQGLSIPIYSDSKIAMGWVVKKKCKTKLERLPLNEKLFQLIERAENWLKANTYSTTILKWDTKNWGEIPADFGRK